MSESELAQKGISSTVRTLLREAIQACLSDGLSFAVWKLPASPVIHFAASSEVSRLRDVSLEDNPSGFLFAPFDPQEDKVFLPAQEMFTLDDANQSNVHGSLLERISRNATDAPSLGTKSYYTVPLKKAVSANPDAYASLVCKCQEEVLAGRFEKLVPSRTKEVTLPDSFDIGSIFLELGRRYPTAMVSLFSSPETGTWMGATPEMLVSVDARQRFRTAAVAGTQPYVPGTDLKSITWTQKEIEEQALVERYIIGCFKKIRLREFDEHGPRSVVAGNVVHLKTEFEVDMVATRYPQLGSVMLQLLHPTSAVCGMPMEQSLAFLKAHEGYPREFYSGFLGPVKINGENQLFVNLRCMQLSEGQARLYAGGGVLGDSDPEKEWQETELKLSTLLSVIRD